MQYDTEPLPRETRLAFMERTCLLPSGKRAHVMRPDLSNVTLCGRIDFNQISDADLAQVVHRNLGVCGVCRGLADGDWITTTTAARKDAVGQAIRAALV